MELDHLVDPIGPPDPRVCSRCRKVFAGDPLLPLGLDTGWWTCPVCHEHLHGAG
ncbi:MAG: hypothetical protein ACYC2O_03360 [Microthrixaceae bacterium]